MMNLIRKYFLAIAITITLPFSATADANYEARPFDLIQGNKDATVYVIEYASLSCSHCALFHKEVYPLLKAKYIDTGKIAFIYRDFPLNLQALHAAMLSQCAGDRKDKYVSVFFNTQDSWAYDKKYIEKLSNITKLGGMPAETFDKCLQDKIMKEKLASERQYASEKYDIKGTPSFIVNGAKYPAMGIEQFSQVLDAMIESTSKVASNDIEPENKEASLGDKEKEPENNK